MSPKDFIETAAVLLGLATVAVSTVRYFARMDHTLGALASVTGELKDALHELRTTTDARLGDHERRLSHVEGRLGRRFVGDAA